MKNLVCFAITIAVVLTGCKKDKDTAVIPALSVSNSSLDFSARGETLSFDVRSNVDWTLTGFESLAWINVSPVSDSNNATVTVWADVNSSPQSRSTELTLTGKGVSPVKVSIVQQGMDQMKITSFSPLAAGFGSTLTIKGEKFAETPGGNIVKLNGVTAEVLSANLIEINVSVPKDVYCSGFIEVSSGGATVVSETRFTYMLTCTVSTVAGNGTRGFVDGASASAQFNNPFGIAVDASGNLYVADNGNQCIRKISSEGIVSTLAGNGVAGFADGAGAEAQFANPTGVAVDATGNVYVADRDNNCIRKISPSGTVSTFAGNGTAGFADGMSDASQFDNPFGMAFDASGNLLVTDINNHRIRKIDPAGTVKVLAGSGERDYVDANGTSASFNFPFEITVDASNNAYVTDVNNHCIRKISPTGDVSTLAGSGIAGFADGMGEEAQFRFPKGVAVDAVGNVYVADESNNGIRHINSKGLVTTIIDRTSGFADGAGDVARFNRPYCMAVDHKGIIYVSDLENQRIRKIVAE